MTLTNHSITGIQAVILKISVVAQAGLDPPDFTEGPFWRSFWIGAGLIMLIVLLVGAVIALVTRIEQQATVTTAHLAAGKEASAPFEDLVEANVHLRAIARASRSVTSSRAGARR